MAQAPLKFGIKDFVQEEYLGPHFLVYYLFQMKIRCKQRLISFIFFQILFEYKLTIQRRNKGAYCKNNLWERESDQANNFTKKLIPLTILPNLVYWQFKLLVWNQKLHSIPIWKETIRHILLPLHFENNESDIILGTSWMFAKNLSSKYLNCNAPWGKNICIFQM